MAHAGKMRLSPVDRYLSALIDQCLACSPRKRKATDSNPTEGRNFSICNSWLAILTGLVSPCK